MAAKNLQFMLVRWLGEETLSVLPSCKTRRGDIPVVGLTGDFKWSGRFYEGEILAISGNRQKLNTLLKQLSEMVITREELLEAGHDADVSAETARDPPEPDSTTPNASPQKVSTQKRKRKLLKASQSVNTKDSKKAAKIKTYQERAREMFKDIPKEKPCDKSDGSVNFIKELQKELAELKQQLSHNKSVSKATKKTSVSETNVKSTPIVGYHNDTDSEMDGIETVDDYVEQEYLTLHVKSPKIQVKSPKTTQYVGTTPSRYSQQNTANHRPKMNQTPKVPKTSHHLSSGQEEEIEYSPKENDDSLMNSSTCTPKMKQVELVEGYGVYLTQKQYDEAIDQSGGSPTRMIRNLITVFFKPTTLAQSSCLGKRGRHPALNQDIVGACLKFVMNKYPSTKRAALVNEVNDKCANFRRKATTKEL